MKRCWLWGALALCVFPTMVWAANINSHAAQALVRLLNQYHSMRADFQQVLMGSEGVVLRTSSGSMALVRPGKFRWQTMRPDKQLLITRGRRVWIYDVDLAQVVKRKLSAHEAHSAALLLSGSAAEVEQRYWIKKLSMRNELAGGNAFQLLPKSKNDAVKEVRLYFMKGRLVKMDVVDRLEQTIKIRFRRVRLNAKLPDSLFRFKAPKGVEVIGGGF